MLTNLGGSLLNSGVSLVSGVVFLAMIPLVTSLLNGGIAWIADDPIAARLEATRESLLKNRQQQADLDAALQTLPGHNEAMQMLAAEDDAFNRAAERVQARVRLMHVVAIQVLEEALAEPSVTSQLSEHGLSELNRSLKAVAAEPTPSIPAKSADRKYA